MHKFIKAAAFFKYLFDQERLAAKAAVIVEAILAARSPRLTDIAQHMPGHAGGELQGDPAVPPAGRHARAAAAAVSSRCAVCHW